MRFKVKCSILLWWNHPLSSPRAWNCQEEPSALVIFKWLPFPSPCQKPEGIFLWYLLWQPGRVSGGKSYYVMGFPLWWGPPWVSVHIEPSAACQLQFTFSFLALAVGLCPVELWPHVFTQPSLHPWGQWFARCPPLSYGIKKNYWFFSLCSFPLVRT